MRHVGHLKGISVLCVYCWANVTLNSTKIWSVAQIWFYG